MLNRSEVCIKANWVNTLHYKLRCSKYYVCCWFLNICYLPGVQKLSGNRLVLLKCSTVYGLDTGSGNWSKFGRNVHKTAKTFWKFENKIPHPVAKLHQIFIWGFIFQPPCTCHLQQCKQPCERQQQLTAHHLFYLPLFNWLHKHKYIHNTTTMLMNN